MSDKEKDIERTKRNAKGMEKLDKIHKKKKDVKGKSSTGNGTGGRLKFIPKMKELRIVLHDIARTNLISANQRHLLKKEKNKISNGLVDCICFKSEHTCRISSNNDITASKCKVCSKKLKEKRRRYECGGVNELLQTITNKSFVDITSKVHNEKDEAYVTTDIRSTVKHNFRVSNISNVFNNDDSLNTLGITPHSRKEKGSNGGKLKDDSKLNNKKRFRVYKNLTGIRGNVNSSYKDIIDSSTSSSEHESKAAESCIRIKNIKARRRDEKYYRKNKLAEYDLNSNLIVSHDGHANKHKGEIEITHSNAKNGSTEFVEQNTTCETDLSSDQALSHLNGFKPRKRTLRRIISESSETRSDTNISDNTLPSICNPLGKSKTVLLKKKIETCKVVLKPCKISINKNDGSFHETQSLKMLHSASDHDHKLITDTREGKDLDRLKESSSPTLSDSSKKKRKLPKISDDYILPVRKIKIVQIKDTLQNDDSVAYDSMKIVKKNVCERGTSPIIFENSKEHFGMSRNNEELINVPRMQKLSKVDKTNDGSMITKQKNSFEADSVELHSPKIMPYNAIPFKDIVFTNNGQHNDTGNTQDLSKSNSLHIESQITINPAHQFKSMHTENIKNIAVCESVTCEQPGSDVKLLCKADSVGTVKNPKITALTIKNVQTFTKEKNNKSTLEEYVMQCSNTDDIEKKNEIMTLKLQKCNQLADISENSEYKSVKKIKLNRTSWSCNVLANKTRISDAKAISSAGDPCLKNQVLCRAKPLLANTINNISDITEATQKCLTVKKSEALNEINNDNVRTKNSPSKKNSVMNQKEEDYISSRIIKVSQIKNSLHKLDKEEEAHIQHFDNSKCKEIHCNEAVDDSDEDDDAISLFADSSILDSYIEIPPKVLQNKSKTSEIYAMTGDVLDKYIESNKREFNTEFAANIVNNNKNDGSSYEAEKVLNMKQKISLNVKRAAPAIVSSEKCPKELYNRRNNILSSDCKDVTTVNKSVNENVVDPKFFFFGYCFKNLRVGFCRTKQCLFKHNFQQLIQRVLQNRCSIQRIIQYVLSQHYDVFAKKLYQDLLPWLKSYYVIDMYKKFYNSHLLTSLLVSKTLTELLAKDMPLKLALHKLAEVIQPEDSALALQLIRSAEHHIKSGEYWNTLRKLLLIYPNKYSIEHVLQECIQFKQNISHIEDVNKSLISNLHPDLRIQINNEFLKSFDKLMQNTISEKSTLDQQTSNQDPETKEIVQQTIASPDSVQRLDLRSVETWNNMQKVAVSKSSTFILHPIDDLPEPTSIYRDRFWKFHLNLHSLREGLRNNDYDHVIQILNQGLENNEQSLYVRSCYKILCAEIKRSQKHLRNIIARTVQTRTTTIYHEMLFHLATCILIRLVDEECWVLAYQLLKSLELYTHNFDAAFVILAAQVCIATHRAVKAVCLFKQTNIIYTNCNKWCVLNNKKDNYSRAKTMALLLEALCIENPKHAYYLFNFLIKDQKTYYDPVDLTSYADKITTALLRSAHVDMIIDMGRLIIKHDITLRTITYRALITTLVRTDMILAKQLYQLAITMGVYNRIKLMPVVHIIVNSDWAEEELYLMFVELLQQLLSHIGHGIDHIGPNQLSIYLVFEAIPTDKDLSCDIIMNEDYRETLKRKKMLAKKILIERFNPPIQLVKQNRGKICKLNSRSLVTYLSSGHYV